MPRKCAQVKELRAGSPKLGAFGLGYGYGDVLSDMTRWPSDPHLRAHSKHYRDTNLPQILFLMLVI